MARSRAFRLGEREGGSARIEEEAVTVNCGALKEETRERDPRPTGGCADRSGLRSLGFDERQGGTARLEGSIPHQGGHPHPLRT
jgi:hypothetical protein